MVTVSTTPTEGLEVGMSRTGMYAKGIALDLQEKYTESYKAYRMAKKEFDIRLKEQPRWSKMIRGWKLKATFQEELSGALMSQYYRSWPYSPSRMSYYKADAMHDKWLAIRAFTGQLVPKLRDKVVEAYKQIIQRNSYNDQARIALAAMYHEMRKPTKAKETFAKVRYPTRRYYAKDIAYYYTVAGKYNLAFQYVQTAIKYSHSNRRYINQSNKFDRLRTDKRFKKLIGPP